MNDNKQVTVISAFITNLGKYNEGELVGKWHGFPTTKDEVNQTLKRLDKRIFVCYNRLCKVLENPICKVYKIIIM